MGRDVIIYKRKIDDEPIHILTFKKDIYKQFGRSNKSITCTKSENDKDIKRVLDETLNIVKSYLERSKGNSFLSAEEYKQYTEFLIDLFNQQIEGFKNPTLYIETNDPEIIIEEEEVKKGDSKNIKAVRNLLFCLRKYKAYITSSLKAQRGFNARRKEKKCLNALTIVLLFHYYYYSPTSIPREVFEKYILKNDNYKMCNEYYILKENKNEYFRSSDMEDSVHNAISRELLPLALDLYLSKKNAKVKYSLLKWGRRK